MNMFNKFNFLLYCFFLVCLSTMLEAQPLQYFDVKDSVNIREINVHYTSDTGWVNVGVTMDSSIILLKYDRCGRKQYIKKFHSSGRILYNLNSIIVRSPSKDIVFVTAIYKDSLASGIFTMQFYPVDGSEQFATFLSIPGDSIYMNPCIGANFIDRSLSFNSGNDSSLLSGHLILLNNVLAPDLSIKLDSNRLIRDHLINNGSIIASVDSNLIIRFDKQFKIIRSNRLDSQFVHFNRGMAQEIRGNVICSGQYFIGTQKGISLIKLDSKDTIVSQSTKSFQFDPIIEPNLTSFNLLGMGQESGYIISFINPVFRQDSSDLCLVTFNSNLGFKNSISFANKGPLKNNIYSLNADYSEVEESILFSGVIHINSPKDSLVIIADSLKYFNSKLGYNLKINDPLCLTDTILYYFDIPQMKEDTVLVGPVQIEQNPIYSSNISIKNVDFDLDRECSYFDYKVGAAMFAGCVGDIIELKRSPEIYTVNPIFHFVQHRWTKARGKIECLPLNPSAGCDTTDMIRITVPSDLIIVTTTYCDDTSKLQFTIQELNCIPFGNVFYPSSEDVNNKGFNPINKDNHFDKISNIQFEIFNRWGHKIFQTNDKFGEWDGTIKGAPAPMDTYIYYVIANYNNGEVRKYKGTFTLIR